MDDINIYILYYGKKHGKSENEIIMSYSRLFKLEIKNGVCITTGIALLSLVRSRYYDCVRITGVKVSKVSRVHVSTDTISTSLIKSATFISNAVDAASTL